MARNQLTLFRSLKSQNFFGGSLMRGRRKASRPISHAHALHLVIKSQWASRSDRFTHSRNKSVIEEIIFSVAKRYGIRIYNHAICSNHIHLVLRSRRRWLYRCFISVVTGLIAQHVMQGLSFKTFEELKLRQYRGEGVQKQEKGQAFWLHRPFSRIVCWGRDFKNCIEYTMRNTLEALGFIEYKPHVDYYSKWRLKLVPEG